MKKQLLSLALGLSTACLPGLALANGSVMDQIDEEIAALAVMDSTGLELNIDADFARSGYGPRPAPAPGPRPGYGPRPAPAPGPRPGYGPHPAPRPAHVHHTSVVVVHDAPSASESVQTTSTSSESASSDYVGSRLGFGLRVLGNKQSDYRWNDGNDYTCDENAVAAGIGWYIKFRPIRWISIEFTNDYQFGKLADSEEIYRMPFDVGLQFHIFDYGDFDLYAVAAAGLTYVTFDRQDRPDSEHYVQWGGQFGVGASVLLGGFFELGLDIRYTLDEAPDNHSYWTSDADGRNGHWAVTDYDRDQVVHGVTFALTVGFGI